MSRQSKNARNRAIAKQFSSMRKNGESGPSKTAPQHGKKWTYRSNPDAQKRLAEALKGTQTKSTRTSGREILEKAGGASK